MSDHVQKIVHRKMLEHGFVFMNGIPTPPPGMGSFAVSDLTYRLTREAQAEVERLKRIESGANVIYPDVPHWKGPPNKLRSVT